MHYKEQNTKMGLILYPGSPVFYRRCLRGYVSWQPAVVIGLYTKKATIYLWNHRLMAPEVRRVALGSLSHRAGIYEKLDSLKIKESRK
jgi:hypothetical protein